MKLVQISSKPEIWINIGTGAVSRVCYTPDPVSGGQAATVVMVDGYHLRFLDDTLSAVVRGLQGQEQNYEKDGV